MAILVISDNSNHRKNGNPGNKGNHGNVSNQRENYMCLHEKCLLLLPEFNQTLIFTTDVSTKLQYEIS
jgi:hypothetical protein